MEVQDTAHRWHAFDAFTPSTGDQGRYLLSADGSLVVDDAISGDFTIQPQATHDEPRLESPFAYEFVSAPVEQDLVMTGQPVVDLVITPEAPMGQIGAWLYAEGSDGRRLITSGTLDLRLAHQGEDPQPVQAGTQLITRVQMLPVHALLEADETIVLRLWHHGHQIFPHASESGPMQIAVDGNRAALSFVTLSDASLHPYQPPVR